LKSNTSWWLAEEAVDQIPARTAVPVEAELVDTVAALQENHLAAVPRQRTGLSCQPIIPIP
jgi:hypothetical protein